MTNCALFPVPSQKSIAVENYCEVREGQFSHLFNFTGLSNPDKDYRIQHDADVYLRLQPCGVLKKSCNGQGDYSICLNKAGQEIGIGTRTS